MAKEKARGICVHLDIKPNRAGNLVQRRDQMNACKVPDPEMPILPACMTNTYGFKWPPQRRWVEKDDCAVCPMWQARE